MQNHGVCTFCKFISQNTLGTPSNISVSGLRNADLVVSGLTEGTESTPGRALAVVFAIMDFVIVPCA